MHRSTLTLGTLIRGLFIAIIICGFVGYVIWQSRLLLGGPELFLTKEPPTEVDYPTITLEGQARNIVSIAINDRPIMTDERGYFNEDIVLPLGYTILSIEAKDRYGRQSKIIRPFVYTPTTLTNTNES